MKVQIGKDYPATSLGVQEALYAGHRWLEVTAGSVVCDEPLDLDEFAGGGNFLRIDGGGLAITSFAKDFIGGSVMRATGLWHLTFNGVSFDDPRYWDDGFPLLDMQFLDRSSFVNCATMGGSLGMRLGYPIDPTKFAQVGTSVFRDCQSHYGRDGGIHVYDGVNLHFERPDIERCGRDVKQGGNIFDSLGKRGAGLRWEGPGKDHPSYPTRGLGSITDGHFELAGADGYHGIELVNVRSVSVTGNYLMLSHVRLDGDTTDCHVTGNHLGAGSDIIDESKMNRVYWNRRWD